MTIRAGLGCHSVNPPTPPPPATTAVTLTWTYNSTDPIIGFLYGLMATDGTCQPEGNALPADATGTLTVPTGSNVVFCVEAIALDYDSSQLYSLPAVSMPTVAQGRDMKIEMGAPFFLPRKAVPLTSLTRA